MLCHEPRTSYALAKAEAFHRCSVVCAFSGAGTGAGTVHRARCAGQRLPHIGGRARCGRPCCAPQPARCGRQACRRAAPLQPLIWPEQRSGRAARQNCHAAGPAIGWDLFLAGHLSFKGTQCYAGLLLCLPRCQACPKCCLAEKQIGVGKNSLVCSSSWGGLDVVVKLASPGLHPAAALQSIFHEANIFQQHLQPLCGGRTAELQDANLRRATKHHSTCIHLELRLALHWCRRVGCAAAAAARPGTRWPGRPSSVPHSRKASAIYRRSCMSFTPGGLLAESQIQSDMHQAFSMSLVLGLVLLPFLVGLHTDNCVACFCAGCLGCHSRA